MDWGGPAPPAWEPPAPHGRRRPGALRIPFQMVRIANNTTRMLLSPPLPCTARDRGLPRPVSPHSRCEPLSLPAAKCTETSLSTMRHRGSARAESLEGPCPQGAGRQRLPAVSACRLSSPNTDPSGLDSGHVVSPGGWTPSTVAAAGSLSGRGTPCVMLPPQRLSVCSSPSPAPFQLNGFHLPQPYFQVHSELLGVRPES